MYKISIEYHKNILGQIEAHLHVIEHDDELINQVLVFSPTHAPCSNVILKDSDWVGTIQEQLDRVLKYTKEYIALLRAQREEYIKIQNEVPETRIVEI